MRWDRDYKNPEVINDPTIIPAYGVTDEERARWNAKQDALEYDPEPTPYSDKHMISGAIYNALEQYKTTTVQVCQAFFWGQVDGLGEVRAAVNADADRAESARDDAISAADLAVASKDAAAGSASDSSYYSSQAAISAGNADGSAQQASAQAAAANVKSVDSEAWAVGTRNGVPVEEGDPTYHHNSKYYADLGSEVIRDDVVSPYTTWSSNKLTGIFDVKADLENGKVPAAQLPSYVDDVLEYASLSVFPLTGESGKIYIAQDTALQYRWSGTEYVVISGSLALGETSSTAYAGNKGKTNADAIAAIQEVIPGTASSSNKLVTDSDIPTALSDFSDDATHRLVTDQEKAEWDSKAAGTHNHDDRYYTETEIDAMLSSAFNGVTFTTTGGDIYINW